MKCRVCARELVNGANFCMYCGSKATVTCPKCKTELPNIAKYCFNCGFDVKIPMANQSVAKQPVVNQAVKSNTILNNNEMNRLAQIKKQEEEVAIKGAPVWDSTPNGVCDCAVGECDCDGSIWR